LKKVTGWTRDSEPKRGTHEKKRWAMNGKKKNAHEPSPLVLRGGDWDENSKYKTGGGGLAKTMKKTKGNLEGKKETRAKEPGQQSKNNVECSEKN